MSCTRRQTSAHTQMAGPFSPFSIDPMLWPRLGPNGKFLVYTSSGTLLSLFADLFLCMDNALSPGRPVPSTSFLSWIHSVLYDYSSELARVPSQPSLGLVVMTAVARTSNFSGLPINRDVSKPLLNMALSRSLSMTVQSGR
jgi:hypothetical protein